MTPKEYGEKLTEIMNRAATEINKLNEKVNENGIGSETNVARLEISLKTDNILFKSKQAAETVCNRLNGMAKKKGYVSIGDFYEMIGFKEVEPEIGGVRFGWDNVSIKNVKVYHDSPSAESYYLEFPPLGLLHR